MPGIILPPFWGAYKRVPYRWPGPDLGDPGSDVFGVCTKVHMLYSCTLPLMAQTFRPHTLDSTQQ